MKESKVTEGQSAYVLGDVGSGRPPAAMCRKLAVSELRPLRSVDARQQPAEGTRDGPVARQARPKRALRRRVWGLVVVAS